jgi:hypothetical protein
MYYVGQVVSWAMGDVAGLADKGRQTGRITVRDGYRFRMGGTSITYNKKVYESAVQNHAYTQNSTLISKFFRHFLMSRFDTIAFQMELLSRQIPAALETLPGETEIVLWSVRIPCGAWELVLTIVSCYCIFI